MGTVAPVFLLHFTAEWRQQYSNSAAVNVYRTKDLQSPLNSKTNQAAERISWSSQLTDFLGLQGKKS